MTSGAEAVLGFIRRLLIASVLACLLVAIFATTALANGVVPTDKGPVRGTETQSVEKFLGIPYAAPPVAELRWRPPQPPTRWHGPRDATDFGNHCPQPGTPFGSESASEDCLYLNVFKPNRGPGRGHTKHLPVMVWIHGGGFVAGMSEDYDPSRLVERGVVVVTLNYRLGYLGFLAHERLSAESNYGGSGNYGLMDQQAALRWVDRNIKKFGGDPENVTIFGESAGGLSVHAHLVSPLAAGLFDRAIVQSGAYSLSQPSLSEAEQSGSNVAAILGCFELAASCLRSAPVDDLLRAQPTIPGAIGPNLDGEVLPRSVLPAFSSGEFNRVPVIEGSTHDEFTIFTKIAVEPFFGGAIPAGFYPIVVSILVPTLGLDANPAAVLAQYPLSDYGGNAGLAVSAIGTDAVFACPGRRAARALSQFVPTFAYEFADPNAPQIFVEPASFPYGAYHASELAYLFDSPLRGGHAPFTEAQETLAATMVGYWTQLSKSGSPNGEGTPQWPAYTAANDTYQSLVPPTPVPTTGFAADHKCDFWDAQ